jgi:hypothetical protein
MKKYWIKLKIWYANWQTKRALKKKLKKLQEKDPFIYK